MKLMSAAITMTSSAAAATTLIVGLNGAFQKRFVLPVATPLIAGNVHRATEVQVGVGGKGQDVAVTLSCLQYQPPLQLVQFVGSGPEGDAVYDMLQELLSAGTTATTTTTSSSSTTGCDAQEVAQSTTTPASPSSSYSMSLTVRTSSHMRTCTSIVASDATTELVEPSGVVTPDELEQLFERLQAQHGRQQQRTSSSQQQQQCTPVDAICFMGTMPPGCPEDTYAKIYDTVAGPQTLCLIDSVAGLKPLLQTIAKRKEKQGSSSSLPTLSSPKSSSSSKSSSTTTSSSSSSSSCCFTTMLKINASELCRLSNIPKQTDEAGGIQRQELVTALQSLFLEDAVPEARLALTAIAITDGPHPAHFVVMPVSGETELRLFELPVANLLARQEELRESQERDEDESDGASGDNGAGWGQWSESSATPSETALPQQQQQATESLSSSENHLTLYPIGAGDSVAAGTLAAWKVLTKSTTSTFPVLPPEVEQVLSGNTSPVSRAMLTSFSFGLACGSASCLQEQNSVLRLPDAIELYIRNGRPLFLSSHVIRNVPSS